MNDMKSKQKRNFIHRNNLIKNATYSELLFKSRMDTANIRYMFQKGFISGKFHCIVDFYLPQIKTVIEIDGAYHNDPIQVFKDKGRDRYLKEKRGFKVIRIKNDDVLEFNIQSLK